MAEQITKNGRSQNILITADEIASNLGIARATFFKIYKAKIATPSFPCGMPIIEIDRRFYAHADNLDKYIKELTANPLPGDIPEGIE